MKTLLFLMLLGLQPPQSSGADEPQPIPALSDVLSEREFRNYQGKKNYDDRMKVVREVLELRERVLRNQVQELRLQPAFTILREIRTIARHALQASQAEQNQKKLRDKEVRKLEIRIRRLVETLNEVKLSVPFEHRDEFDLTQSELEVLRNRLLQQFFGEAFRPASPAASELPHSDPPVTGSHFSFYSHSPAAQELLTGDRFTDEEFTELQEAQKIVKRTEVFLEIAESRLTEIERRREGREWSEKEENPLEFHTFDDMVHAYGQAIRGIMINIDEQHKYRRADADDIRKALKLLNGSAQKFGPRLEPIREFALERRDETLFEELKSAAELTRQALLGSQAGLGAPVDR